MKTEISFNEFKKTFKKNNPRASNSDIRNSYNDQKRQNESEIEILKIPSITPEIPSNLMQENNLIPSNLIPSNLILEEHPQDQEKNTKQDFIYNTLTKWNNGLRRIINNKPIPLYPTSRDVKVNPLDLFRAFSKNENDDYNFSFLVTLMSVPDFLEKMYNNDNEKEMVDFFISHKFYVDEEWNNKILPPLKSTFINHYLSHFSGVYKKQLDFNDLMNNEEPINPISEIKNTDDFLNKITLNPEIFYKITDKDIRIFWDDIDEIRLLMALNPDERIKYTKKIRQKKVITEIPQVPLPQSIPQKRKTFKFYF